MLCFSAKVAFTTLKLLQTSPVLEEELEAVSKLVLYASVCVSFI